MKPLHDARMFQATPSASTMVVIVNVLTTIMVFQHDFAVAVAHVVAASAASAVVGRHRCPGLMWVVVVVCQHRCLYLIVFYHVTYEFWLLHQKVAPLPARDMGIFMPEGPRSFLQTSPPCCHTDGCFFAHAFIET